MTYFLMVISYSLLAVIVFGVIIAAVMVKNMIIKRDKMIEDRMNELTRKVDNLQAMNDIGFNQLVQNFKSLLNERPGL